MDDRVMLGKNKIKSYLISGTMRRFMIVPISVKTKWMKWEDGYDLLEVFNKHRCLLLIVVVVVVVEAACISCLTWTQFIHRYHSTGGTASVACKSIQRLFFLSSLHYMYSFQLLDLSFFSFPSKKKHQHI